MFSAVPPAVAAAAAAHAVAAAADGVAADGVAADVEILRNLSAATPPQQRRSRSSSCPVWGPHACSIPQVSYAAAVEAATAAATAAAAAAEDLSAAAAITRQPLTNKGVKIKLIQNNIFN